MNARPEGLRLALPLALAACGFLGCRSATRSGSPNAPTQIEVGAGSPDAVARRSARELADSPVLDRLAPRAGDRDRRFTVRLDRPEFASSSPPSSFEIMLENALVATGCFLIVGDRAVPAVHARVSGPPGDEESRVWVTGADGDLWIDVRGRPARPN